MKLHTFGTTMLSLALAGSAIAATESAYVGQEGRAIKALSDAEVSDYLAGRGMATSKAAELNHYPGPRHVLNAAQALRLSPSQAQETQELFDAMERRAKEIGRTIVAKEAALEALYAQRQATPENTRQVIDELSALQGEFRFTHLNAHLAMPTILSPAQLAQYDALRGYGSGSTSPPVHQNHH